MKTLTSHALVACVSGMFVAGALLIAGSARSQEEKKEVDLSYKPPSEEEMTKQMQRWQATWAPSKHHLFLHRFIGNWDTEMSVYMAGPEGPAMKSKGTAEYTWATPGKWVHSKSSGEFGGSPIERFMALGYDNFKQKYVAAWHDSMQTCLLTSEGTLDMTGKTLMLWGSLDEPMTGQTDKSARYDIRFEGKDKFVFEVHDLHIGGANTKVIEVVHTRRK